MADDSEAATGAGGQAGTTGAQSSTGPGTSGTGSAGKAAGPQHTSAPGHSVGPTGYVAPKSKLVRETPQGSALNTAYLSVRETFGKTLPSTRAQIQTLANRHIGG